MLPPTNNEPNSLPPESNEPAFLNLAPRPPVIQRRPAGSMRAAMDLCADALLEAMVGARKF